MNYRNKTYIAFSAEGGNIFSDMRYYSLIKAWCKNNKFDINLYDAHDLNNLRRGSSEDTIKNKLRERLSNSKMFVLLIGNTTSSKHKYVRWEIEEAIKQELPIVAVNLNGKREIDRGSCPVILNNKLAIHVPFESNVIAKALDSWTESHNKYKRNNEIGPYSYDNSVYLSL